MNWYLNAFKNYTNFYGRASRTEYWMFFAFNITFAIIAYAIDLIFDVGLKKYGFGLFYSLYALVSFIPGLALTVRRLHDVNKSGWYFLLAIIPLVNIYLIVLFCTKSDEESNAYGDKPVNSDIGEFLPNEKKITYTIISVILWIFLNRIIWQIITKSAEDYYKKDYYKYVNETTLFIWSLIPLFLSLAVKNRIWKIILLIGSLLYLCYSFYELVKLHQDSNLLQF
jgi:uncharacterized membrane protein YhaH (DUF805 family)